MELNHLRYFYEVAKAGSFTAASKALRVSQPALSKTVAQLEDREGVRLLDRGKKGVVLTEMGELVYAKCDGIFRELQDLADQVRGKGTRCEGPMRIGSSDHIANYLLPSVITSFHRKYPKVVPSLFTGTPNDIVAKLSARELELGLFFTKVHAPEIEYRAIGTVEFAAVYRPEEGRRFPKSPSERKAFFEQLGFIGSRATDYRKHPAEEMLDALGAEPKMHLEANNQETQKKLCLAGYGFAVLPRFMVEAELKQKSLAEIPGMRKMTADIHLAQRKGLTLSTPAQKFLEAIEKGLGD
jgi:DNA-binding transcriptional LysR family regulator